MPHVTGVIASAEAHGDTATVIVFPLLDAPERRIDPTSAVTLVLRRQPWQQEGDVLDFVSHAIGRSGDVIYVEEEDGTFVFDGFYTR